MSSDSHQDSTGSLAHERSAISALSRPWQTLQTDGPTQDSVPSDSDSITKLWNGLWGIFLEYTDRTAIAQKSLEEVGKLSVKGDILAEMITKLNITVARYRENFGDSPDTLRALLAQTQEAQKAVSSVRKSLSHASTRRVRVRRVLVSLRNEAKESPEWGILEVPFEAAVQNMNRMGKTEGAVLKVIRMIDEYVNSVQQSQQSQQSGKSGKFRRSRESGKSRKSRESGKTQQSQQSRQPETQTAASDERSDPPKSFRRLIRSWSFSDPWKIGSQGARIIPMSGLGNSEEADGNEGDTTTTGSGLQRRQSF